MMDRSIAVFGPAVLWEEVLEFVVSEGVFGTEMQDTRSRTEHNK